MTTLLEDRLAEALMHMKACGDCAEDAWNACEGGREALAALAEYDRARQQPAQESPQPSVSSAAGDEWICGKCGRTNVSGAARCWRCEDDPEGIRAEPQPAQGGAGGFDMIAHLIRQRTWSRNTFGPGARIKGVCDHIRKELIEVERSDGDIREWIDVLILAFDGCWRSGSGPEEIIAAMVEKQTRNEGRTWPDWRTVPADRAIEHDRSKDAATPAPAPVERVTDVLREIRDRIKNDDGQCGLCGSDDTHVHLHPSAHAHWCPMRKVFALLDDGRARTQQEAQPVIPFRIERRPLLVSGQLATDAGGIVVLIDSEQPEREQSIALWHEVLHMVREAQGQPHDETQIDADAERIVATFEAQPVQGVVPFAKLLREVVAYVPKGAMYDGALTVHQVVEAALSQPPNAAQ